MSVYLTKRSPGVTIVVKLAHARCRDNHDHIRRARASFTISKHTANDYLLAPIASITYVHVPAQHLLPVRYLSVKNKASLHK